MKNKIKKILFSGILSLVLVFAFAFASLNVLRTDDRAHAADPVSYHFEGALYLSDHDGRFEISFDLLVDEDITIADARPIVSAAIEAEYPTIAVEELYFNDREMYSQDEIDLGWMGVKKLNKAKLSLLATHDTTYDKIILIDGFYGPKTNSQNNNQQEEVIEYMSSYTTPTKLIKITPVANFDPVDDEVYIANSNSTTAPEVTAPTYPEAQRYVIDGRAVNNQEATLPTFAMDYTVTANDGINSILLIPEFERDFFEIAAVKVYNTVAGWDAATITYKGYDKILLEGSDLFDEKDVTLFRIYFKTKEYQVQRNNETVSITGDHTFGLRVQKTEAEAEEAQGYYAHNHYTESYQWLEGTKLGQQEEVGVSVVYTEKSKVNFFVRLTPVLAAPELNTFTYGFKAVSTEKVGTAVTDLPAQQADDLVVRYVYSGNGEVTFTWSSQDAPINASETAYTLTITAAATPEYYGVSREVSVKINKKALTFAIVGGERTYAMPYQPTKLAEQTEPATPFTYTLTGVCAGDDAGDSVAIDLGDNEFAYDPAQGSFQAAGTYQLKAHVTNTNYSFTQNEATYKINKIKITIVGESQQLTFADRDFEVADLPHHPLVDYAGYDAQEPVLQGFTAKFTESVYAGENALYEANANIPLEMVKEIGIELQKPVNAEWKNVLASGSYEVLVVPTSHANYDLTVTNGSLTILTVMKENPALQFVASFFEGKVVYYNAEAQDLLEVKEENADHVLFPTWLKNVYPEEGEPTIRWTVENNSHTHTGENGATANNDEEYVMTIRTELNNQDALNYTEGQQVFVFNVTGYLRKLHITLTANDTTSVYGDYIAEEVPNNNVNYSYTVSATPVSVEPLENRDSDVHKLYEADVTRVNNRLTFTNGAVAAARALAESENETYGTYGEGANVGNYTLALTASELSSLTDYVITVANGKHTVTKAPVKYVDPQAEEPVVAEASAEGSGVKITALPAEVYYNRSLQLTTLGTVKVGDLVLAPNKYDIHLEYNNHSYNQADFPWNVGDYVFVVVTLQTSSNYFGASKSATFRVNSIALAQPVVSYHKNEVTWEAVTKDAGHAAVLNNNQEVVIDATPAFDLVNGTTLVYTVYEGEEAHVITPDTNGVYHYLADSTDDLTIVVHSSNNANYTDSTLDLLEVHSVTYNDGDHDNNEDPNELTGMPGVEYLFHGEAATEPDDPALVGYTFAGWYLNDALYPFDDETEVTETITPVTASIELVAHWTAKTYTVTVNYRDKHGVLQTVTTETAHYNQLISATDVGNLVKFVEQGEQENTYYIPATFRFESKATAVEYGFTEADFGNIYGFHTWKYTDELNAVHAGTSVANALATLVKGDCSFDAEYTEDDHVEFEIRYQKAVYVSAENAQNEAYSAWALPLETEDPVYVQKVKYKSDITYYELPALNWLARNTWFADQARNVPAMTVMTNENIVVYGAYVFDIGNGDVNASTTVSVDDITIYRQWIVGGYDIEVVAENKVLDAVEEYNANKNYFLRLVADVNGDNSLDIRDVSTIRMTIAGGYGWEDENGYNVSGHEVIRNVSTADLNEIGLALKAGNKVTLSGDVTAAESALALSVAGNVTLDLNGKTLTVAKVDLTVTDRGTLTVKNGTIVTTQGITLRAPYGNVTIEGVNGFDENGAVNLQAAEHSLHLAGKVGFYKGVNTTAAQLVKAAVKVAKNTHVVIEPEAELIVEKLVVAKVVETTENETVEFTVPTTYETTDVISIDIQSDKVEKIDVVGKVENGIATYEELVAAGQKGGIYTLVADIDLTAQVVVSKALALDLNGHTLSNTTDIWHGDAWSLISVQKGGDLTIKGNGELLAKENDCYAVDVRDGANLVIENGTFVGNITAVYAYVGTVTINGGHFSIKQLSDNETDKHRFTLNLYDASRRAGTATIVVKGGEFEHFNPSNNLAEGPKTNFVAAGYVVSASEDVYTVTTGNAIASLDDLNNARANGGNYVLMADVVYEGQKSFAHNTTIELNGYKLQSLNHVALSATDGATLTLNGNGTVEAQEACVMAFDASHVVINGGTYTAHDNFVLGTNGSTGRGGNTITVNGGVFNGLIESAGYVACGIYVANSDTVVVNGGKFVVTNGVGILARSGNTTVANGVVLNVTGNSETLGKVGDSRVVLPAGSKLVLDFVANYPGGDPTLTNNTSYDVTTIYNNQAVSALVINNLDELKAFRDDVNAGNNYADRLVILNADIELDGAWEAISNYSRKDSANESKWFAGTFDGRGHVISGLTNNSANIVEKEEFTYGLFGSVKNAVIKNLTLASVNISTNKGDSLGALVGYYAGSTQKAEANISNITVSGTVDGADNVGGVVGRAAGDYFKAENVTVNGTVTALKKAAGVVGTGNAHEMVFADCANHAAVSSTESDSNQGYNTVAGISITWKGQDDQHPVCTKVVLTNCSNDGVLSTCNTSSLAGQLAVDYSPKTQLDLNGTWTYANGQWTRQ